ncbi:hypothetical protein B0H17DRAFT_1045921 [Mycena rosella]|uniref:Malate dehydrogenase n=1 Tax=Mycena rosella TaxID=1033263 RepID=A0AAD7DYN1_MYCRO|nr:hypothetical protein B0H17DRAFT_1045921 [Mycena rosella]
MFSFQLLSALFSVALLVSAAPAFPGTPPKAGECCDTSAAIMDLPKNQTQLVAPTTAPLFVALGVGIQNYTCSTSTLKYTSTGAVASLFDISCIDKTPAFATIQTTAFNAWKAAPASLTATAIGAKVAAPSLLGFHYFVTAASGTGISPKWDFTSTGKNAGNATAFVIGAKVGDITAPTDSATNVDWLALNNAQGSLASKIFRIDTVAGQPPASCVAGSADISVKYTAKYYLY